CMQRTVVFLAGSLAFPYISQIYPPLDLDLMLVVFGVIFFVALTLAVVLDRRARRRQELEMLKHVYGGFILLPWILAGMLFVNGTLDSQKNLTYHTAIVDVRYNMPTIVRGTRRVLVRRWRTAANDEPLPLDSDDSDRLKPGGR